jgi:Na+-transporting NADH:ubiquinone oxidoreductase subunit B
MVVLTGLWLVLPMVLVTYAVGFFWEILFATIRKHEISEGLFVSCMLFPLTLPPATPLWQVALGISFGIVIGKEVFGGTGRNFLNPALTGRAFLYFAYPVSLSGDSVWTALVGGSVRYVDGYTAATPLSIAASTAHGQTVETALDSVGYSPFDLFFGLYPGSIGGTSTFLCILGALFLIMLGIASWRIILGGVLGVLATAFFLNLFAGPESAPFLSLNPFYHLIIGGSAFGIAYMTTDPVSATHMRSVKWVYGFMCGMLTVMIRVFNPAFPEGVGLAILFMNCFNPLLDHIEVQIRTRRRVPNV